VSGKIILGESMWTRFPLCLYSGTVNCRFHIDTVGNSAAGIYVIGAGGWYYRRTQISKDYLVPTFTVDTGWKFYMEARYHCAWNSKIPAMVAPVMFGFRFN